MAFAESLAIHLSGALLSAVAKIWFKDVALADVATSTLSDLLKEKLKDFYERDATEQILRGAGREIVKGLHAVIESEFSTLSDNDREAAVHAVADVFSGFPLSSQLFATDLEAARLEKVIEPLSTKTFQLLGEEGRSLARLLLQRSCIYVVRVASKLPDFQVGATREILKRETELAEEIKNVVRQIEQLRDAASKQGTGAVRYFEERYRQAIVQRYDRLDLFGLRLVGAGARKYRLSVAYVTLTAAADHSRHRGSVDAVLGRIDRHVVIHGEAGSGKTTLLQWLAVHCASADFSGPLQAWNDKVPFYISLRDYAQRQLPSSSAFLESATPLLVDQMPSPKWVGDVLTSGRGLLLIDGIDELPAGSRTQLTPWLESVIQAFPLVTVILTSRRAALSDELSRRLAELQFTRVALETMSLTDSEALVAQWHDAMARDLPDPDKRNKLRQYQSDLCRVLRERLPIRSLCTNPLLCAMICALNWDRDQRLPDERLELYRLALELLLERRDDERGILPTNLRLAITERRELLESLAYWMLRRGATEAPRDEVEDRLKHVLKRFTNVTASPSVVLQELLERSGVIREPQSGLIDFIHRTFLEYLGANAALDEGDLMVLVKSADQEYWRETIVFAAGHAKGVVRYKLIDKLLKWRLLGPLPLEVKVTAVCCLETVSRALEPSLLLKLQDIARALFPPSDVSMARALAPAAALKPELLMGHQSRGQIAVAGCIRIAASIGGEAMLRVIEGYTGVDGAAVDMELASAIDAFPVDEFVQRVLRRRIKLFDIQTDTLDDESAAVLMLLLTGGAHRLPAEQISRWLGHYRRKRELDLLGQGTWEFRRAVFEPESVLRPHHKLLSRLLMLEAFSCVDPEPDVVEALASLPMLTRLRLTCRRPVSLDGLRGCEQLRELQLSSAGVGDLRALADCKRLEQLYLQGCSINEVGQLPLTPRLRVLSLQDLPIANLEGVAQAYGITLLEVHGGMAPIDDWLERLISLETLLVWRPNAKARIRIPYAKLARLKELSLSQVDAGALSGIGSAPTLTRLSLSGISAGSIAASQLPAMLQTLEVSAIEHVDLNRIERLTNISEIHLRDVASVAGVENLLQVSGLKSLRLPVSIAPAELVRTLKARGVSVQAS